MGSRGGGDGDGGNGGGGAGEVIHREQDEQHLVGPYLVVSRSTGIPMQTPNDYSSYYRDTQNGTLILGFPTSRKLLPCVFYICSSSVGLEQDT